MRWHSTFSNPGQTSLCNFLISHSEKVLAAMSHRYISAIKALIVFGVFVIAGCGTPNFVTKERDESYQEKLKTLEMVLIPGSFTFPSEINSMDWYEKVGVRMQQNFRHNGLTVAIKIGTGASSASSFLLSRSVSTPLLILTPETALIQNRQVTGITIRARLYANGKSKPVWEGLTTVATFQAGDELSLKILNDLSNLKLVDLSHIPAQTVDGKKSYTFGGLLTP